MTTQIKLDCPRCGAETFWYDNPHRPFCSEKCRLVDLGRWASEDYSIDGETVSSYESDETGEF